MSAPLLNDALQAVAAAAADPTGRFPGAAVAQCAYPLGAEDLFGDPAKWPTVDVPLIAIFDGAAVATEPRARGPLADLQTFQEAQAEIVAWVRGADHAALSIAARQARFNLIALLNDVAIANPYSDSHYGIDWLIADVAPSPSNVGFYVQVRVRFRVHFEE